MQRDSVADDRGEGTTEADFVPSRSCAEQLDSQLS